MGGLSIALATSSKRDEARPRHAQRRETVLRKLRAIRASATSSKAKLCLLLASVGAGGRKVEIEKIPKLFRGTEKVFGKNDDIAINILSGTQSTEFPKLGEDLARIFAAALYRKKSQSFFGVPKKLWRK